MGVPTAASIGAVEALTGASCILKPFESECFRTVRITGLCKLLFFSLCDILNQSMNLYTLYIRVCIYVYIIDYYCIYWLSRYIYIYNIYTLHRIIPPPKKSDQPSQPLVFCAPPGASSKEEMSFALLRSLDDPLRLRARIWSGTLASWHSKSLVSVEFLATAGGFL